MSTLNRPGNRQTRSILILALIVILAFAAYGFLTMPDRRNAAEKIGDAIHELPQGPDKAMRELESRTPGEKIGDAIKDTGDTVKEKTGD